MVAKLMGTTLCIGCKAAIRACSEWNDLRIEVGSNVGVRQPQRLDNRLMDHALRRT